jgi:hypothetical protein
VFFFLLDQSLLTHIVAFPLSCFRSFFYCDLFNFFELLKLISSWTVFDLTLFKEARTGWLVSLLYDELLHGAILLLLLRQSLSERGVVLEAEGGVLGMLHNHVLLAGKVEGTHVTPTRIVEIHIHFGDCSGALFSLGNSLNRTSARPAFSVNLRGLL